MRRLTATEYASRGPRPCIFGSLRTYGGFAVYSTAESAPLGLDRRLSPKRRSSVFIEVRVH